MDTLLLLLVIDFLGNLAWVWLVFIVIVVTLLAFDLGVLHKEDHEIGVRESLLLSAGYMSAALEAALTNHISAVPDKRSQQPGFMSQR